MQSGSYAGAMRVLHIPGAMHINRDKIYYIHARALVAVQVGLYSRLHNQLPLITHSHWNNLPLV